MDESQKMKESLTELMDHLGIIGQFMFGELRSLLRKGWGGSKEEFMAGLNQVVRSMKQSGKWAAQDIDRAAELIRKNWKLLAGADGKEWDLFVDEICSRLQTLGQVTRAGFETAVDQARKALDMQWDAAGRMGEKQIQMLQEHSRRMADSFKDQWEVFWDNMEKHGKKVDRAVHAAWEELKKQE